MISLRGSAAALAVVCLCVVGLARASGTAPAENWLAYGNTSDIANVAPADGLTPAALSKLKVKWQRTVGGWLVAQPLYVSKLAIGKTVQPVLFVATGDNNVWALSARTGVPLWRRSLGAPAATSCGGHEGIASTPAIDLAHGVLYVIGGRGLLHALRLSTGREVPGWPLQVVTHTEIEIVWSPLRLVGGRLYVAVGNTCDAPSKQGLYPDGRLLSINPATRRVVASLDVVPGPQNMGGIWALGGVSVDPSDGSLWIGTDNAHVVENGAVNESAGLAEKVLRLSPALHVLGTASQPAGSPAGGFGSTPLLFHPSGCPPLAAANSTNGMLYVWRRGSAFGSSAVPPVFATQVGPTSGAELISQPTYVSSARTLVVSGGDEKSGGTESHGPTAFRVDASCTFTQAWHVDLGPGTATQPLAIGGVVVVLGPNLGKLATIDAASGNVLQVIQIATGAFSPPIAANGVLYDAAPDGVVRAFTPAP